MFILCETKVIQSNGEYFPLPYIKHLFHINFQCVTQQHWRIVLMLSTVVMSRAAIRKFKIITIYIHIHHDKKVKIYTVENRKLMTDTPYPSRVKLSRLHTIIAGILSGKQSSINELHIIKNNSDGNIIYHTQEPLEVKIKPQPRNSTAES